MTKQYLFAASIVILMLGSGSCSKSPATYCPLDQGRVWTYQMLMKMPSGVERSGTITITNLAPRELDGKTVTPEKEEGQGSSVTHYIFSYLAEDPSGVLTVAKQDSGDVKPTIYNPPRYLIKKPIRPGTTWAAFLPSANGGEVPAKATIESTDETVDVPAGTFKHCVKIHIVGDSKQAAGQDEYRWLAPSIGLIKVIENGVSIPNSILLVSFKK